MFDKLEIEQRVAEFLLQIKAIKLQPNNPFTWSSGWKSPIYCDNRITLSHPTIRTYIRQQLTALIQEIYGPVGCIAGVATAGIPHGVLIAQEMGLPFIYVRAKAKEHGKENLIEGDVLVGKRVVVVEDTVSTGKSSLAAVEALRDAGYDVAGLVAIFSYGFDVAIDNFRQVNCPFATLSNYNALIKFASSNQFAATKDFELSDDDVIALKQWRENPAEWGQ